MDGYELLDDPGRFADVLGGLTSGTRWSLDTEFVRERTYYARLCLVQLAAPGRILLVDPIRVPEMELLRELLRPDHGPKVVHAARQDIEVLLPLTGEPLAPVFDTQVAASLLGFPAQIGYAGLVNQLLGVELAKGHARTDWAARPLKPEQLAYAADDVRYLGPVAEELEARLTAAGRLDWLAQDCHLLADPSLYRIDPVDAWRRLKGLERMDDRELAVLQALAAWREERAMRRDLPRGWVIPDETLRELARRRPDSEAALQRVPALPGALVSRFSGELLALIADTATLHGEGSSSRAQERLAPEQNEAIRRMQDVLQRVAGELGIAAEVLATRRDLTAMVRGAMDVPPLNGWRRDVIGERLLVAM